MVIPRPDMPSSSSSATDHIPALGSLHTRGRLGGVRPLCPLRRCLDPVLASLLPLTGGDIGMITGSVRGTADFGLGRMTLMIGSGLSAYL